MPSNEFRRLLLKAVDRQRPEKKDRDRGSLGTHMLGTLSLALGIVALLRIPDSWHGAALISQSISMWLDPPPPSKATFIPPYDPAFARYYGIALVGQFLGIVGAWLSRKMQGTLSLLSVNGVVPCAVASLPVYGLIAVWTIIIGWPVLLAIATLVLVVHVVKIISTA